jgi:hypothetical protein
VLPWSRPMPWIRTTTRTTPSLAYAALSARLLPHAYDSGGFRVEGEISEVDQALTLGRDVCLPLSVARMLRSRSHPAPSDARRSATFKSDPSRWRDYNRLPPSMAFAHAKEVRDLASRLAQATHRPRELADLYIVIGQGTALMASLAFARRPSSRTSLTGGSSRYDVRDFLLWAGQHGHCGPLTVPVPSRNRGADTDADQ